VCVRKEEHARGGSVSGSDLFCKHLIVEKKRERQRENERARRGRERERGGGS
jgi:hypothetical protein